VVASAQTTPIGPINFERGVVAVDAVIGTFPVRFFNTHLEVRNVDPTNPLSPVIQAMQAVELTAFLNLPKDENSPVIVVGDLNSSPEHMPVDIFLTPYMQLEFAGYFDVWTLRPGKPKGFTCCQAEDLLNPESILYERVDMIFCSELPINKVQANPVGNDEAYKTPSGLWPSDHAGVVARMEFAP
jgi:endonuclease/exonuclease/phosphatase family metal-dependent hydrolase